MKILNTLYEDYHVHSMNYSDGLNTIDELTQYAGKIGMKKIVITDHSQAFLDARGFTMRNWIASLQWRKNVHNEVDVSFGVEWDLLDEEGNCCFDIQGKFSDFCILSCHEKVYRWSKENLTQAYVAAIEKHHDKISCLGHLNLTGMIEYLDLPRIIALANRYAIPVEFNTAYFSFGKMKEIETLLTADQIYINWDIHMLSDFLYRKEAFGFLESKGYV